MKALTSWSWSKSPSRHCLLCVDNVNREHRRRAGAAVHNLNHPLSSRTLAGGRAGRDVHQTLVDINQHHWRTLQLDLFSFVLWPSLVHGPKAFLSLALYLKQSEALAIPHTQVRT